MSASMKSVKVGTKVVTIEGPGQSLASPARRGEVVKVESTPFGPQMTVRFEDGAEEGWAVHSLAMVERGIGIYVAPEAKGEKRIHVRVWSGSLCARVTEMVNAGKRGKTCRTLRFSWGGWTKSEGYGEVLHFFQNVLPRLTGEESLDDVALLGRVLSEVAKEFSMHEESIRGVDAPRDPLTIHGQGWSAGADESGVTVADLTDHFNEPRSISRGSPARAYTIAKKVFATIPATASYHEVVRLLEFAGCDLHSYCAVD